MLALEGALVTIGAMGCQSAIAERVVERGADYLLSVKENQPSLCEAIGDAFLDIDREPAATLASANRPSGRTSSTGESSGIDAECARSPSSSHRCRTPGRG